MKSYNTHSNPKNTEFHFITKLKLSNHLTNQTQETKGINNLLKRFTPKREKQIRYLNFKSPTTTFL